MPALLNACNISFVSSDRVVFSDVSLQAKKNDIISIVGANGSGKTAFLKIISGMLNPSSGTLAKAKTGSISYMPQKTFISPHLPITVSDFFALRATKPDQNILSRLGIGEELLAKNMHQVSGGQLQRILFATTIMCNAEVIILDEPEQNLDASSKLTLYELIVETAIDRAVIIASHDPDIVFKKSTKILHFSIDGAVHYDNIKDSGENKISSVVKNLFESYFSCDHDNPGQN